MNNIINYIKYLKALLIYDYLRLYIILLLVSITNYNSKLLNHVWRAGRFKNEFDDTLGGDIIKCKKCNVIITDLMNNEAADLYFENLDEILKKDDLKYIKYLKLFLKIDFIDLLNCDECLIKNIME